MPPFFTSLPETLWPEVSRRLSLEPALRDLAANEKFAAAFLELGHDLDLWRPGPLGLAALAALEPQSAPDPIHWLKTAGREHLAKAYNDLISNSKLQTSNEAPPIIAAVLAAVALRQRLAATDDLESLIIEAADAPDRWALPLVCLYGLLDNPRRLIIALLREASRRPQSFTVLCELAARILIENESLDDLINLLPETLADLPSAIRLAFARFFAANGQPDLARAACHSESAPPALGAPLSTDLPSLFHSLGDHLQEILLAEYTDGDSARTLLGRAVEAAQTFTAELALHFGHRSLADGDPISAIAAFQEAQTLRPYDRRTHALIAEAAALRGDERTALIELGAAARGNLPPSAKLAMARAHNKLGEAPRAREIARELLAASAKESFREKELREIAELFSALDDHDSAVAAWGAVTAHRPADFSAHLARARHALEAKAIDAALDSAWQAVGLNPNDSTARQALAESLSRAGDSTAALTQWQRAAEIDHSPFIQLKLAGAALEAKQYDLALAAADRILRDPNSDSVAGSGAPHIIAGRALTALGQPEKAFKYFNQAIALAPASVESWRAVAAHHRAQGDLQRAIAALDAGRQVIDHASPDAAELYADLGNLRAELHHFSEATTAFEKASSIAPLRADFHRRLGELYAMQNKTAAAVEALHRAATVAATDPALWHLLGQTLETAGRRPDALAAYRRAQTVGGGSAPLFRDLGRLAYQLGDIPMSRAALESALVGRADFAHDDLDSLILLGAIYEQAREYDSALTVYKHAIALEPMRSDLCARLGVCCFELGQPEAAIAALKDAAERDLDNLALQKVMGQAYASAHLWDEAELAYEQASRLAPDDHRLLQTLARAAKQAGAPARAVAALQKAIALAPDSADYRRDLAEILAAEGKLPEARAIFAEACNLMPDSCDLLMGLGQTQLMLNELKDAVATFEKAASLSPNRAEVMLAVGESKFALSNFDQAHAAFISAAELDHANPVHLRRAGDCMWEIGRQAVAIALWQKALVAHPDDPATHARLGSALMKQGRCAEALVELEHAARRSPSDSALAVETGRAALRAGEAGRAINHLERAARLTPDDAGVWQLLGEACRAKGLNDKALAAFRKAALLAPESGAAHAAMARLLTEVGNMAEALTAAEAALRFAPDDLDVLASLAEVFVRAGRIADAVSAALKVSQGRPNDPSAHMALARALVLDAEAQHPVNGSAAKNLDLLTRAIERAAALGADIMDVREWAGRARALFGDVAEAISMLEAVAAARPSTGVLRALASCYRRAGKLQSARQAALTALEHAPDAVANLVEFGLICLAQDDKTAARAAFQRIIALDFHFARAYQLLAETMIALGERAEALVVYNQAISLDPSRPAWHHRLAELYDMQRDPASALAHYQRAAALALEQESPANETAGYLAALARAHARDHDLESARQQFEAALALRDDSPTWWSQCAQINFQLGNFERAFECFSRASELQPNDTASFMGAARAAIALGREAEAEKKAASVLRHDPDNYDALIVIAEVYERRGDPQNALVAYAAAAEHAANPAPALMAQARLLRALKHFSEAVKILKRVAQLAPEDDEAIAALGEALAEANQPAKAIVALQHAAQIAPRKTAHLVRLGRLCRAMGQLDAALGHLQHARELAPENPNALREMALVFEGRRQYSRAYELYQLLMSLEPDNAENFFRAGLALKEMRDYLESAELFQRAARLDPTLVEAERQRATVAAIGILRGK